MPYADQVRTGIGRIVQASASLLQDVNYALLSSKPVADMVIYVIVATELLKQAQAAPHRFDLAASWVNRKMLELEMHAERVGSGGVDRITRCERIVSLFE